MKKFSGRAPSRDRCPALSADPLLGFGLAGILFLSAGMLAAAPLRIVDPEGKPVSGAHVEVLERREPGSPLAAMFPAYAEGDTDSEGYLPMALPNREGLLVLIDHSGFLPLARPQTAKEPDAPFVLQPGRTLRDRVQSAGREIRNGRICASWKEDFAAWREARIWKRCGEISAKGEINLTGLPAGEVTLEAQAPGFLLLRRKASLPLQKPLRLVPGVRLSGRITGPGPETPVAHATVRSEGSSPAESREDGSFSIAVPRLPATLAVSAPGFRQRRVETGKELRKGGLAIRLERGEQARGTLVDEERKPVRQAVFWIEEQTQGRFRSESRQVETKDGSFLLDLPEPGVYRIRIQGEGFREEPLSEISVAPGESYLLGSVTLHRGSGIEGTAVDALSLEPLQDVEIEILPEGTSLLDAVAHQRIARTVSDRQGRFRLSGMTTGRFGLTLRRVGYAPAVQTISVEGNRLQDLGEIALGRGSLLRGRVLDREGKPRSGLTVRVLDREGSSLLPLAERTTDPAGRFEGPRLAAGPYRLQIRGNRLLLEQEIEVPEGHDEWPLDLVAGGVRVAGAVTRGGEPVRGGALGLASALDPAQSRGKILISSPAAEGSFSFGLPESRLSATVRSDGTFELDDVPDGALILTYSGDSGSVTRNVFVPDAARARLDVEIGGTALEGQVVSAGQETGLEAIVRVVDSGNGGLIASQPTDSQGFFSIPDLQPGRYTVQASAEGYETQALTGADVQEGAPPLRISLRPGGDGELRLRLRYPDGTPAPWVPVTLFDASGGLAGSLPTNGNGEVKLSRLPSGTYWLVWSDAFAGAGASEPIRIDAGQPRILEKVLPEGGPLEIVCDLDHCAGHRIDAISIVAASGAQIGPQVSGASPALRFSADGRASLGRLSPGTYKLQLWIRGEMWTRGFSIGSEGVRISLP